MLLSRFHERAKCVIFVLYDLLDSKISGSLEVNGLKFYLIKIKV